MKQIPANSLDYTVSGTVFCELFLTNRPAYLTLKATKWNLSYWSHETLVNPLKLSDWLEGQALLNKINISALLRGCSVSLGNMRL